MKPTLTLALAALLLAVGCKKDDPEAGLPPATQEGKNTGGCLVNGERFVAVEQGGSLLTNPIPALQEGFSFDSVYYLKLNGNYKGNRASITLFLKNDRPGSYSLNKNTRYYPQADPLQVQNHATFSVAGSNGEVYVTSAQYTGQVILAKADVRSGIASGTFEFTAASTFDPGKTITITKGRFDRKQ